MTYSDVLVPPSDRVAIIGAGPSGIYVAAAITRACPAVSVDVFDQQPAPFGLVRYGVAPDHLKIKSVARVLSKPFTSGRASFFGNVDVGQDISLSELRELYHAVVLATGCPLDRELGIDGDDLPGTYGSREIVGWYSGHADFHNKPPDLGVRELAIVGGGNVALDIARVLARSPSDLLSTDVPDCVVEVLNESRLTDLHIIIRRGPAQARFTAAELVQLAAVDGVGTVVHDDGFLEANPDPPTHTKHELENLRVFRAWAMQQSDALACPRRVHFHFFRSPARVLGSTRVQGLGLERTIIGPDGQLVPAGEIEELRVAGVIRAIGHTSRPMETVPASPAGAGIPNLNGRVVDGEATIPGLYVVGWAKRGPSGVIGTNLADANETAAAIASDLENCGPTTRTDRSVTSLLAERGIQVVRWHDWERLDKAEIRLGQHRGSERVKVAGRGAMLAACSSSETA